MIHLGIAKKGGLSAVLKLRDCKLYNFGRCQYAANLLLFSRNQIAEFRRAGYQNAARLRL